MDQLASIKLIVKKKINKLTNKSDQQRNDNNDFR